MSVPQIRIFEIPEHIKQETLAGSVAVVIDVLRATSSMAAALKNGCMEIYPVVHVDEAFELRKSLGLENVLLCGERKGVKIDGFDFGNSPLEYDRSLVQDKKLVWTTTNGTKAMQQAQGSDSIYIASLLNLKSAAQAAARHDKNIHILCSGTNGQPTLEDNVCAGLLVREIVGNYSNFTYDNDVKTLLTQAESYENNLYSMMMQSKHGRYLYDMGFDNDLRFCSQIDLFNITALYDKRVVKLAP